MSRGTKTIQAWQYNFYIYDKGGNKPELMGPNVYYHEAEIYEEQKKYE